MANSFPDLGYTGKAGRFSESLKATRHNDDWRKGYLDTWRVPRGIFKTQIYKVKYISHITREDVGFGMQK